MVKFEVIVAPEIASLYQNRVVCDVCEYHITDPLLGKMASWRGSVKDEYFSILFVKGVLTVSLVERECQLGHSAINYAMSEPLVKALRENKEDILKTDSTLDYFAKQGPKEQEIVHFIDVMVILNWRYAERAKINYDTLMN
jgi:hypothetical protein